MLAMHEHNFVLFLTFHFHPMNVFSHMSCSPLPSLSLCCLNNIQQNAQTLSIQLISFDNCSLYSYNHYLKQDRMFLSLLKDSLCLFPVNILPPNCKQPLSDLNHYKLGLLALELHVMDLT